MSAKTCYLNLGCGSRYHPDWVNIDIVPHGPGVIKHDLSRGIPFPDLSCDVVYHSAMLEHMRRPDASTFMVECHRVLKPGGIVRVGVPDLERLCLQYLSSLTAVVGGDETAANDYEWIMLELFDQIVREKSGGGMLDYLKQNPLPNEKFVYDRIGEDGRSFVNLLREKAEHKTVQMLFQKAFKKLRYLPGIIRRKIPEFILGTEDRKALQVGRFRLEGEVHQWMYDRYSLSRLLINSGFKNPQLQNHTTSQIPNWPSYNLDTFSDGTVIKPDLFFMEATK